MTLPRRAALVALAAMCLLAVATGCSDDDPPVGTTTIRSGAIAFRAVVREPTDDSEAADIGSGPLGKGAAEDDGVTVLFLHGASYTSRIWADRGVLEAVAGAGHRAVAVDLPGAGGTASTDEPPSAVLADLIAELGAAGSVVVVSPSASGLYSLSLLAERPEVELAGFVAVAPAGIGDFDRGPAVDDLPTLLIWGADDDVIPVAEAEILRAQLPGARLVEIEGGSHAPYDDEPGQFTEVLLDFLANI